MRTITLILVLSSFFNSFAQSEDFNNLPEAKATLMSKIEKTNNAELELRSNMFSKKSSIKTELKIDTTSINENSLYKATNNSASSINSTNLLKKDNVNKQD
ncbi:hypothetical protein [Aequorivita marina]|uniref:hypothetical protein n=1 Tax=Aequorivita marina TaxID=3073654 RepID=UPI002876C386|nr:hypothetical protein [Aequorivita sp. S2608]MDS1298064.1 hypothetical protein [Aequorivita sp. S2608]